MNNQDSNKCISRNRLIEIIRGLKQYYLEDAPWSEESRSKRLYTLAYNNALIDVINNINKELDD
jgi:hypothetical protein